MLLVIVYCQGTCIVYVVHVCLSQLFMFHLALTFLKTCSMVNFGELRRPSITNAMEITLSSRLGSLCLYSLGNPDKGRQRFVDATVSIYGSNWLKRLSNFENVVETPFEFGLRTSNDARFCQIV